MTNEELQHLVKRISDTIFKSHLYMKHISTVVSKQQEVDICSKHITFKSTPNLWKLMELRELEGIIRHELCHYHLHIEGKGYKHRDKDFKDLLKRQNLLDFVHT